MNDASKERASGSEKIYDYRTYQDYIKLADVPTQPFLMISELVDNAISSFDNKYGQGEWKKILKILIEVHMTRDVEKVHGLEVYKGSFIRVTDNGFGISRDRLAECLTLNAIVKQPGSGSKMSVHGRGLKQCAFHFGCDLTVKTMTDEYVGSEISLKFSEQTSPTDRIVFEPGPSDHDTRGTLIQIEKIYKRRRISPSDWDAIVGALEQRYLKMLDQGDIEINYLYTDDMAARDEGKCIPRRDNIAVIADEFDRWIGDPEKLKNFLDEMQSEFITKKNRGNLGSNDELANQTFSKMVNLFEKSAKDSSERFEWEQSLPVADYSLNCKFWMLSKKQKTRSGADEKEKRTYSPYRGMRVYNGPRAIMHPPILRNGASTYLGGFPSSSTTGSTENRLAGEFVLEEINGKTTTDKSKFELESPEHLKALDESIGTVFEVYNIFQNLARKEQREEKAISKSDMAKRDASLRTKPLGKYGEGAEVLKGEVNKSGLRLIKKEVNGADWKFSMLISEKKFPEELLDEPDIDFEKKKYTITVNVEHSLWKNIDKNPDYIVEIVQPLVFIISTLDLENRLLGRDDNFISRLNFSSRTLKS